MEWDGIPFKVHFKVMLVGKQRLYGMKDSRKTVDNKWNLVKWNLWVNSKEQSKVKRE